MIYVIAPFSRPNFLTNLINNFKRQEYPDKKLIIIENGKAIGACKKAGFQPDVLLTSEPSAALAKNEGLIYLKENFDNVAWTTFDDDDYYGPNHLNEIVSCLPKAEIVGRYNTFMKTSYGIPIFMDHGFENTYAETVYGYTITSHSKHCELFPDIKPWGEDNKWLQNMKDKGAKIWAMSRFNSLVIRHNNHTWDVPDIVMLMMNPDFKQVVGDIYQVVNQKQDYTLTDADTPFILNNYNINLLDKDATLEKIEDIIGKMKNKIKTSS